MIPSGMACEVIRPSASQPTPPPATLGLTGQPPIRVMRSRPPPGPAVSWTWLARGVVGIADRATRASLGRHVVERVVFVVDRARACCRVGKDVHIPGIRVIGVGQRRLVPA